jgi:hypothetical protein
MGFSVASSLLPIMKLPPRSMFISGSLTAEAAGGAGGLCDAAWLVGGAGEAAG